MQLGIGGWQVPRSGVQEARKRGTNVLTIADIEKIGLEKTAEIALELAWKDADAVYISFDVNSIDCGFVPGTGWPEPGGFLPREALKLLGLVAAEGLCGLEVVEVSPPYDTSDITALVGVRVVVEALGSHGRARQARQPQEADRQAGLLRRISEEGRIGRCIVGSKHHRSPSSPRPWRAPAPGIITRRRRARCSGRRRICRPSTRTMSTTIMASPISIWWRWPSSRASPTTKDPTSFLRLARIPFEATDAQRHQAGAAAGGDARPSPMSAR